MGPEAGTRAGVLLIDKPVGPTSFKIVQQVRQMGEKAKVSVRNIRRDANKQLDEEQKSKAISEDDRDKGKKDIDNLTKEYADKIDEVIKAKSEEIMLD